MIETERQEKWNSGAFFSRHSAPGVKKDDDGNLRLREQKGRKAGILRWNESLRKTSFSGWDFLADGTEIRSQQVKRSLSMQRRHVLLQSTERNVIQSSKQIVRLAQCFARTDERVFLFSVSLGCTRLWRHILHCIDHGRVSLRNESFQSFSCYLIARATNVSDRAEKRTLLAALDERWF